MRYTPRLALLIWLMSGSAARAQDLVPGAFRPVPVSINVVTLAATINGGDIAFDPSLPLDQGQSTLGVFIVGFNRTLSISGRFASIGIGAPIVLGHVQGLVLGQFAETSRTGAGDLVSRIAINLYGAPAMTPREFAAYRPGTVVGVSATVGVPIGQYDPALFINIGANRWSIKPEVGVSRTEGRWTFEGDLGATFFGENTDFAGGTRSQAPIVETQAHLIYTFRPALWIAGDGNFWTGGRVTTAGVEAVLEQRNSRLGITVAVPVKRQQVRISYSAGAFTTIGGDYQSLGASYSYAWAAGRPASPPKADPALR
jgi:outer membrane putative beta-barrel porin/alpha-amylase